MQQLQVLRESLYQDFFTGKGSLALELHPPSHLEGEAWELFEKKGKLHLKGDSEKALIYALSFLRRIPPLEAVRFLGKHAPRFPLRALHVTQKKDLHIADILTLGYNTLVGNTLLPHLNHFPLHFSQAHATPSRDALLKDLLIEELKEVEGRHPQFIFFISNHPGLVELNFEASHAILAFEGEAPWQELRSSPPFWARLMPYLRDGSLPSLLPRMERHPFAGAIIESADLSEPHLWTSGFAQFLKLDQM